jgi:hypothetical protein
MDESKYEVMATRAAGLSDAEARRRLAAVYRIILEAGRRKRVKEDRSSERAKKDGNVL